MYNETDPNTQTSVGFRLLVLLLSVLLPIVAASAAKGPNVVVLFADDLGSQDIGCYGGPVKTPTLDSLAARGVRFSDFHSACSICSPSRASLLTGRNHIRSGVYFVISGNRSDPRFGFPIHKQHLLEREVTLAEVLRDNGYATAHFGKWHLGLTSHGKVKPGPDKHGFDYWFATEANAGPSHTNPTNFLRNGTPVGEIEGTSCQILVDDAISWLDNERDTDKPFFLNIWFHEPHSPLSAPDDIVSQYGELDDVAAVYSGTIDNTDRAIARLVAKLEEVDLPENTLIVYASDHGSYRPDRNGILRGKKGSQYEGGTRAPGIFYWPGTITNGRVEPEPSGLIDLVPTVCGLVGIDKPSGVFLDGSDLSPLLTGSPNTFIRHQPLFWILPSKNPSIALRDGKYALVGYADYTLPRDTEAMTKLFEQVKELVPDLGSQYSVNGDVNSRMTSATFANREAERLRIKYLGLYSFRESWIPVIKSGGYRDFELYDLSTDPSQKNNIAAQRPDVTDRLKKTFLKINASVMADGPDWK